MAKDAQRADTTMKAAEARTALACMDSASQLERARRAEEKYGKGRKTVLAAIDEQLQGG